MGLDEPGQDLVGNAVVAAVAAGQFEAQVFVIDFVVAAPQGDAGVIADFFDEAFDFFLYNAFKLAGLGIVGVAHGEILPDEDAALIT